MSELSENQVVASLSAALVEAKRIGNGAPYSVVPEGFSFCDLEHTLENPTRKRAKVLLNDADSFVNYVKLHDSASCNIYGVSGEKPSFIAVLNDNYTDGTGWRDHHAKYSCPMSVEWETWIAHNKSRYTQANFAQFIEDNLLDIVEPSGADMLEISRSLEAKKKVNFSSSIRLANGQTELTYEEEIQGTASKGKLNIPETFSIGIAVFESGDKYRVDARLRYRIDGGSLQIWYDLIRPHKVLEDAVMNVWKAIETKTGKTIFNGIPNL